MSIAEIYNLFRKYPNICTDSRHIVADSLFFALKGPNFNGNAYAGEALEKGAAYAIVDEAEYAGADRCLLVEDALKCLQELGTHHRRQSRATIIALTGSNGKTTTKELISRVLNCKYKTLSTEGNLNNHIGVPLTLLRLRNDTEMAVVEMGANHQGEIGFLSGLAEPDFGYITNFGKAHLEGFGGVEGVIKGKSELYTYLLGAGKHVFFNADDPIQREKLNGYQKKIGFSSSDPDYFQIENLGADPCVRLRAEGRIIETQLSGGYNYPNCAIAVLVGTYFDIPLPDIKEALEGYVPANNRSQIVHKEDLEIILDAYNANPSSMEVALRHLAGIKAPKKIAILGDMFELGAESRKEHQAIADLGADLEFDRVYLVGETFSIIRTGARQFVTYEDLAAFLRSHPIKGPATVLIKASRGMALERVLEFL
ncbi:MAG: UDP-N-acetylmuramoyl-tripeptide--D-alanyl-D-alanine ligase [Robiginitalea sp.]